VEEVVLVAQLFIMLLLHQFPALWQLPLAPEQIHLVH
jgi:hypothetical protein